MSCLSTFVEQKILNQLFGGATAYVPPAYWLALGTQAAFPTGPIFGGECARVGGYDRQQITAWTVRTVGNVSTVSNTNPIVFPRATFQWGVNGGYVDYWALCDSNTTGYNIICSGQFTNHNTVNAGQQVTIAANAITISLS